MTQELNTKTCAMRNDFFETELPYLSTVSGNEGSVQSKLEQAHQQAARTVKNSTFQKGCRTFVSVVSTKKSIPK